MACIYDPEFTVNVSLRKGFGKSKNFFVYTTNATTRLYLFCTLGANH